MTHADMEVGSGTVVHAIDQVLLPWALLPEQGGAPGAAATEGG